MNASKYFEHSEIRTHKHLIQLTVDVDAEAVVPLAPGEAPVGVHIAVMPKIVRTKFVSRQTFHLSPERFELFLSQPPISKSWKKSLRNFRGRTESKFRMVNNLLSSLNVNDVINVFNSISLKQF